MKTDIMAPMKSEILHLRITPETKKLLQEHANKYGIPVTSVVMIAIAEYFAKDANR